MARVAAWEAEVDYARRQEQIRQTERQARENSQLMQQVGSGTLGVCALALNRLVEPTTGELAEPLEPRDLPPLMRAGGELIQLACGMPTQIVGNGESTQLENVLRNADDQTRQKVLLGLRAALEWQERQRGGGAG